MLFGRWTSVLATAASVLTTVSPFGSFLGIAADLVLWGATDEALKGLDHSTPYLWHPITYNL